MSFLEMKLSIKHKKKGVGVDHKKNKKKKIQKQKRTKKWIEVNHTTFGWIRTKQKMVTCFVGVMRWSRLI